MNRFDRALAILLLLRSGRTWPAPELAARLGVSVRTIYRDIDTLDAVGVPIYAEAGREGGFRLIEGYFLPPVAFTAGEATSLLTGLALLGRLHARPFAAELDTAEHKLLAAVPDPLREMLARARQVIGFEAIPPDTFHPERTRSPGGEHAETSDASEAGAITTFLRGIFERQAVTIAYHSPYGRADDTQTVTPYGILWDRDRWYLVGQRSGTENEPRLWRADRVVSIRVEPRTEIAVGEYEIEGMLNRRWLGKAMAEWAQGAPVTIRMGFEQADRLRQDWYYAHAQFEADPEGGVLMTFGEVNQEYVFELLRWLGPGAELIRPGEWRADFARELRAMLGVYEEDEGKD